MPVDAKMLTTTRYRLAAHLLFWSCAALLGSAAHLVSELFELGWRVDARLILSADHAYLAVIAVASLASLIVALRLLPRGERRVRVEALTAALPFKGSGFGFTATAFVAQFGFCAFTLLGEGRISGDDVVAGILAGALTAALGAVAVTLCKRRFLEFALALVWGLLGDGSDCKSVNGVAARCRPAIASPRRSPFAFRYRPPPIAA